MGQRLPMLYRPCLGDIGAFVVAALGGAGHAPGVDDGDHGQDGGHQQDTGALGPSPAEELSKPVDADRVLGWPRSQLFRRLLQVAEPKCRHYGLREPARWRSVGRGDPSTRRCAPTWAVFSQPRSPRSSRATARTAAAARSAW